LAQLSHRVTIPADRVEAICLAYARSLIAAAA
jgi:hypothetical protein